MAQKAIVLTETLARASGQDAGCVQMRKAGRTKWNLADYNLASETTMRLMVLGGMLPMQCYTGSGFGDFPYVTANNGSWIKLRAVA